MTFTLPLKTKILWQMRILFASAFICAFFISFSFIIPALVVFALSFALGFAVAFIYIPLYHKRYVITVNNGAVSISKGVIIKTVLIMPFPRLVFVQTITTPLANFMKLKCVLLKAARSWMLIPEITNIDADYLINNLKVKQND